MSDAELIQASDPDMWAFLERLKRTTDALEAALRESSRLGRWGEERKAA